MIAIRRKAFTLIELLVVIAIIAILAAILFPVFARAREQARKTQCLSNTRQIGQSLRMYVDEYKGTFPRRRIPISAPQYSWKQAIYPYMKNTELFRCPSNNAARKLDDMRKKNVPTVAYEFPAGYFMYDRAGLDGGETGENAVMRDASVQFPATSLIVGENSQGWVDSGPWIKYYEPCVNDGCWAVGASVAGYPGDAPNFRSVSKSNWSSGHSKLAGNLVYMDGHAAWRRWKQTFQSVNSDKTNEWQYDPTAATLDYGQRNFQDSVQNLHDED